MRNDLTTTRQRSQPAGRPRETRFEPTGHSCVREYDRIKSRGQHRPFVGLIGALLIASRLAWWSSSRFPEGSIGLHQESFAEQRRSGGRLQIFGKVVARRQRKQRSGAERQ